MKKVILLSLVFGLGGCEKPNNEKTLEQAQKEFSNHVEDQKQKAETTTLIDPKMDIVDLAVCTAASMKIGEGIGVYRVWTDELTRRYKITYPAKSESEIESYVGERIDDKLKYLRGKGLENQQSFSKFYRENCKS
ncbi:hypothetical protein [Acinetobacter higginsii]|uniref:hypothetical protein n=1 Tax=Acinetobacter higginsii TaxID=70347 RepID=UPI00300AEFB5